jgi:hypothetical protein
VIGVDGVRGLADRPRRVVEEKSGVFVHREAIGLEAEDVVGHGDDSNSRSAAIWRAPAARRFGARKAARRGQGVDQRQRRCAPDPASAVRRPLPSMATTPLLTAAAKRAAKACGPK